MCVCLCIMCCVCVCDVAASEAAKRYRKSGVGEESGSTPGGVYACVQTPGCWLLFGVGKPWGCFRGEIFLHTVYFCFPSQQRAASGCLFKMVKNQFLMELFDLLGALCCCCCSHVERNSWFFGGDVKSSHAFVVHLQGQFCGPLFCFVFFTRRCQGQVSVCYAEDAATCWSDKYLEKKRKEGGFACPLPLENKPQQTNKLRMENILECFRVGKRKLGQD